MVSRFETIHPFLDGNGRIGRLLITFLLCQRGVLTRPLLYLSHFFMAHRPEYYDRLQAIRDDGRWEEWLVFFLRGVRDVAREATHRAGRILALREGHREALAQQGRASSNLLRLHDTLFSQPIVTTSMVAEVLDVSRPTANAILKRLVSLEVLTEVSGRRRNRRFTYGPYLALFEEPTSPDRGTESETGEDKAP